MIRPRGRCRNGKHKRLFKHRFLWLLGIAIFGEFFMLDLAHALNIQAQIVEQSAEEITLQYVLSNTTRERVYAFDRLLYFDDKGVSKLDETGAYVSLDVPSTARIVRGVVKPPMYMSVSRRPPIIVSPIEPGGRLGGKITLPLPMRESSPFFPPQACDAKTAKAISKLRLQIGWVEQRESIVVANFLIEGKEMLRAVGGWEVPRQRVAQTEIAVQGLGLCSYPGRFDAAQLIE